jgi:hypothetical protein
MASVKGLVPCRAAGGGSLRPDSEFSLCVEVFVFFAGSIHGFLYLRPCFFFRLICSGAGSGAVLWSVEVLWWF